MAKPGPNGQTPVNCDLCHKTFKDRSGLSGHRQFAHGIHPRSGIVKQSVAAPTSAVAATPLSVADQGRSSQQHLAEQNELTRALRIAEESFAKQLERVEMGVRQLAGDLLAKAESDTQKWAIVQEQQRRLSDLCLSIAVIADETYVDVHADLLQASKPPWRDADIQTKLHNALRQFLEDEDWGAQAALLGEIELSAPPEVNHFETRVAAALDALMVKRPKLIRITRKR